jgi:hypothetical protein
MTETELLEELKHNFAAEIKRQAESKVVPVPFRIGPNTTMHQAAEQYGLACYGRVKYGRPYACDAQAKFELRELTIESQKAGNNLVEVITVIADTIPGWLQQRPAEDAGIIPALPICKITGERTRNPWLPLPGSKPGEPPRFDYKSQNVIKEQSPRLAKFLADCAKHGGPTAHMADELESERIEAEQLRKVQYTGKEWEENLLRPDSGANLTEQMMFSRSVTDPWLLQFHRQEAAMGSPTPEIR